MDSFILSLSTRILADESILPIRHAAEILKRDMRQVLTSRGPENQIRVVLDGSFPRKPIKRRQQAMRSCFPAGMIWAPSTRCCPSANGFCM